MAVNEKQLNALAQLFPDDAPLYAVGGFVRDKLIGIECHDVDVCSKLNVDDVKMILSNTDFAVLDKNLRVGTVIIKGRNFSAEYTTFRTDSYPTGSGVHSPSEVTFTDDIKKDALRRDFGCNALYFDIKKKEIVDPLSRKGDVENRILKTTDNPEKVFGEDGLRILRLIRFAVELGFSIDDETFAAAKKYAKYVEEIAVERINDELNKIFVADTAHPELQRETAHYEGLELLDELGLVEILFPEVNALKGLGQNPKYHLFDAYVHTIECFKASAPEVRWAALLHDIGKFPCVRKSGKMYGHEVVGADMAVQVLSRFKKPKAEIARIKQLVQYHMVNLDGLMSHSKQRWFVVEHFNIADDLAKLKKADAIGASGAFSNDWINDILAELKSDGTPLSMRELKVSGQDLVNLQIDEKSRGIILYELWRDTVMNMTLNDREKALAYLEKRRK